ncbi:MAG: FAD-binding oxidoreductase, partial [Chloroflexi bacterium]|nr:FAD-binding oxidoreductase [Chloroflexota bacterium]
MATFNKTRRSIWTWGLESDEPTEKQRSEYAKQLSESLGVTLEPPPIPRAEDLKLRDPRIKPPASIAGFCFSDNYERASHSYGADKDRAVFGEFPNPPDIVAHPRSEQELEAVLEWCSDNGYATIPYGGGSSVVEGVTPPEGYDGIVTIDMD